MATRQKEIEKPQRPTVTRISITVDPTLRRNMRIAAALRDMEVGEWASMVLGAAADKATAR